MMANLQSSDNHGSKIARILFYLGVLTISFDNFLVLETGFTIRFPQLCLGILILFVIVDALRRARLVWPLAFGYLCGWTLFMLAFIPNTNYLTRSVGYGLWLVFCLLVIVVAVRLFDTEKKIHELIKWYLLSYFFVALFGLLQFCMPILGLDPPLVAQWWEPGRLARINGFSFEPSYFVTYMITGWVLCAYMAEKKAYSILSARMLNVVLVTVSLVVLLSGSRMGWAMVVIWIIRYPVIFAVRLAKGKFNKQYFLRFMISSAAAAVATVLFIKNLHRMTFLLFGVGVAGTYAGSVVNRLNTLRDTWQVFLDSPFIGYSLGGVASAIGNLRGIEVTNMALADANQGMSVFAEVLAASGIIGFIPFAVYIGLLIVKPLRLAARISDREPRALLGGLVLSLIFALVILQMNQNILRQYLWLHIAILSAVYHVSRKTANGNQKNNTALK